MLKTIVLSKNLNNLVVGSLYVVLL